MSAEAGEPGQAGTAALDEIVEIAGVRLPKAALWEAERVIMRWAEGDAIRADLEVAEVYRIVREAALPSGGM